MTAPKSSVPVKVAALALAAATLSGCVTLLPKQTPIQLYRFSLPQAPPTAAATVGPRTPVLVVTSLPSAARGDGLLVMHGNAAAYIAGARWVSPAAVLFQDAAQAAVTERTSHLRLASGAGADAAPMTLRISVRRFEVDDARPDHPSIRLTADVAVLGPHGEDLAAASRSVSVPAAARRVSALVEAYDQAVGQVLTEAAALADVTAER